MTDPQTFQENSHTDDIIGVDDYTAPEARTPKGFKPWHKPRKQFVRSRQWCAQISRMISDVFPENNTLKYLGLPGDDLLDLRYIHQQICKPNNLKLKFLGFNYNANPASSKGAELNISLDEISKLELIDPSSDVIGDNICQIANQNSVAWDRTKKMGPFDIINFDLCDGFGNQAHDGFKDNHYNTVYQLMSLQARRTNPWLLLLTTRTGQQHTNTGVLNRLRDLYNKNLVDCPEFLRESSNKFAINDSTSLAAVTAVSKGISDVFLISICKWIATLAARQNPAAKVEIKSVIGYNIDPQVNHQDLISIAIRIEPTLAGAVDPVGLANHQATLPDECATALQALNKVHTLRDADSILSGDKELMGEMITETASLLSAARYDVSAYEAWAQNP